MWILNGSGQGKIYSRLTGVEGERLVAKVYDRALEEKGNIELAVDDGAVVLDIEVDVGGVLELSSKRR